MHNVINIGVLGFATVAKRSIIPAIIDLKEHFTLKGVASRTEDAAKACAVQFNTEPYVGYDVLLNSGQLDAVYIPLPNAMHAEWIEKALHRNIHVLVEKSLACSYEEVRHLNQMAEGKQLVLVENFQFRFHRQLSKIKELANDGTIGELRCVRSSFGFPPFSDTENIRYKQELGGGALLDAGAYPVKIAQMFLGNQIEVKASSLSVDPSCNVDIWGGAYLQQRHGPLFAELAFGFDHYYQCNLELWGSKGKLTANRIFTSPPGFSPEILLETADGREVIIVETDNHFQNMLMHVYRLITTGNDLEEEYEQNIVQARLLKEVKLKAHAG
jgi:dTDP-3,4-didehydro-2,6-dideoxy-alpha-D-glucose 3-reductase